MSDLTKRLEGIKGYLDGTDKGQWEATKIIDEAIAALSASEPFGWIKPGAATNDEKYEYGMFAYRQQEDTPVAIYTAPPAPSVAVTVLHELHVAEHAKLGEMLLDKSEDGQSKANWQGGRVNGIGAAISALSAQVQNVAERKPLDLNITKEWFEKRAALEADHEIGAGSRKLTACIDPTPDELAELFKIAHRIPDGWQLVPVAALSAAEQVKPYGYVVELVGLHEGKEIYVYRSRCQPRLAVAEACVAHWATIYDNSRWRFKIVPLYAVASALPAQVQDVAGWQLVPKEPTQEMLDAADRVRPLPEFYLLDAYRAMLAAAPAKQDKPD